MHVLITRPERDAADLKARIEALGCRVTVAPLLEIELLTVDAAAVADASALVATSRNGLRALAQSLAETHARAATLRKPLFVVGPATAAFARDLGFTTIFEGGGTADALVPVIAQFAGENSKANSGPLVHLAGDHLAFDLGDALRPLGVHLKAVAAYRSVAAKTVPPPVGALLAAGQPDAVILMSPRSAKTWSGLVGGLATALPRPSHLEKIVHICLSSAVAQGLAGLVSKTGTIKMEIANQPNTDEIVALVYRLAGGTKTG